MNLNFKKWPARTAAGGAGFTMIELLVVIAIIGILSGIVLTSLGTARTKAREASATASLSSTRSEAELGADSAGSYKANLCGGSGTGSLTALLNAVHKSLGGTGTSWGTIVDNVPIGQSGVVGSHVVCYQNAVIANQPTAWSAGTVTTLANGKYFCADNSGFAGEQTTRANTAAGPTDGYEVCARD